MVRQMRVGNAQQSASLAMGISAQFFQLRFGDVKLLYRILVLILCGQDIQNEKIFPFFFSDQSSYLFDL